MPLVHSFSLLVALKGAFLALRVLSLFVPYFHYVPGNEEYLLFSLLIFPSKSGRVTPLVISDDDNDNDDDNMALYK